MRPPGDYLNRLNPSELRNTIRCWQETAIHKDGQILELMVQKQHSEKIKERWVTAWAMTLVLFLALGSTFTLHILRPEATTARLDLPALCSEGEIFSPLGTFFGAQRDLSVVEIYVCTAPNQWERMRPLPMPRQREE